MGSVFCWHRIFSTKINHTRGCPAGHVAHQALQTGAALRGWARCLCLCLLFGTAGASVAKHAVDDPRGTAGDMGQLHYAQVNGVRIAFRIEGSGIPVVFVHGESCSHELWEQQITAISGKYLFLSYDRRGHGQSEAPVQGYSTVAHAEDLNALLEYLGISDAHFVVHSRGGVVMLQFLRLYPQKVRSITFAEATVPLTELTPFFKAEIDQRRNERRPTPAEALANRDGAKSGADLFTRIAHETPKVREVMDRMTDQYSLRVIMDPQRSDFTGAANIGPWNRRDFPDMSRISQPIMFVVAAQSDPLFDDEAKEAHRLWPNTRYYRMEGVDHLLMLEQPEKFNALLLRFLDEVDTQAAARDHKIGQVP